MEKRDVAITIFVLFFVFLIPLISSGTFWDKITGKASDQTVALNITVTSGSAPTITRVDNITSNIISGPTEATATYITINFTASDADGFGNLNDTSAMVNVSNNNESYNRTVACTDWADFDTDYVNYTCNVTMWWFDGPGNWTMHVSVSDAGANLVGDSASNFTIGITDGLANNRSNVTWASIAPGATDIPGNEIMFLNNTGNVPQWLQVNATNLTGETNADYQLGANNFSMNGTGWCQNTSTLRASVYVNISDGVLAKGNYTLNDGTAQEQLYTCLETSNADLIAQSYSTDTEGSWTIKVVNQ